MSEQMSGRTLLAARIVSNYGQSTIDCVVRNVTNSGARIGIANTVELPEALGLTFNGGDTVRPCRVTWR